MRGDWTQKNSKILNFLNENRRFGIPFNIVYGPSAKSGIMLPEILTSEVVINALKNAE
jgi:suppressor for copper-sensitivity B